MCCLCDTGSIYGCWSCCFLDSRAAQDTRATPAIRTARATLVVKVTSDIRATMAARTTLAFQNAGETQVFKAAGATPGISRTASIFISGLHGSGSDGPVPLRVHPEYDRTLSPPLKD